MWNLKKKKLGSRIQRKTDGGQRQGKVGGVGTKWVKGVKRHKLPVIE